MNVKISATSIIFKISEAEMSALSKGEALEQIIHIGSHDFAMVIDPKPSVFGSSNLDDPLKLVLDRDESCLVLYTDSAQIQELKDMGRSKEGLKAQNDGLDIRLQVDLRSDTRQRHT